VSKGLARVGSLLALLCSVYAAAGHVNGIRLWSGTDSTEPCSRSRVREHRSLRSGPRSGVLDLPKYVYSKHAALLRRACSGVGGVGRAVEASWRVGRE